MRLWSARRFVRNVANRPQRTGLVTWRVTPSSMSEPCAGLSCPAMTGTRSCAARGQAAARLVLFIDSRVMVRIWERNGHVLHSLKVSEQMTAWVGSVGVFEVVMHRYGRRVVLGAITAMAVVLAGCSRDEPTAGNTPVEQNRPVESFDTLVLEGAAQLQIRIGEPASLVVKASAAAAQRVQTSVYGSTLRIDSKPRNWFINQPKQPVTLLVSVPHLVALKVEGGNDVRITGFDGGETHIQASGAVHLRGEGQLDQLNVRLSGAGHADLSQLLAQQVKVTVDGVGSVVVHPQEALEATMNGVGAIFYEGNPRHLSTQMNGVGTIGQRRDKDRDAPQPGEVDPQTLPPGEPRPESDEAQDPEDFLKAGVAPVAATVYGTSSALRTQTQPSR